MAQTREWPQAAKEWAAENGFSPGDLNYLDMMLLLLAAHKALRQRVAALEARLAAANIP